MEFLTTLLLKGRVDKKAITLQTNLFLLIVFTLIIVLLYLMPCVDIDKRYIQTKEVDPFFVDLFDSVCECSTLINRENIPDERHDGSRKKFTVNDTTCSFKAFKRGPYQKVIGFTFYEPDFENTNRHNREYFEGISENLRLISELYPGFIMRLYYQASELDTIKKLCNISCSNPHMDLCDITKIPKLGNSSVLYPLLWRFLPVLDKQVIVFLSRDLDSRISQREVSAVETFLKSDEHTFHVMRDHPAHAAYIMGGTWAVKVDRHRKEFHRSFDKLFKDTSGLAYVNRSLGGYDQAALTKYVWPWAKWKTLSHDSYLCKKYPRTSPFPTQRVEGIGNYVGSIVSLNATLGFTLGSECPFKCRPRDHKDWIYC